jgi:hypothetical protein
MSETPTTSPDRRSTHESDAANEGRPTPTGPWWAQPAVKVLLWSTAVMLLVFTAIAVLTLVLTVTTANSMSDDFDAFMQMDALNAAGVFGRGANAEVTARLRAVVTVLKDNFLGFIGGSLILGVLALAFAHGRGDQRAGERTHSFIFGVLFVAVAGGLVA